MKMPLWILLDSESVVADDETLMFLINEKEPFIGADSVSATMLPPFAVASNLK